MEKFKIQNPHSRLQLWQHPISTDHIVIKIENWEDDQREDSEAGILLSVKDMEVLKDVLEHELAKITKSSNN